MRNVTLTNDRLMQPRACGTLKVSIIARLHGPSQVGRGLLRAMARAFGPPRHSRPWRATFAATAVAVAAVTAVTAPLSAQDRGNSDHAHCAVAAGVVARGVPAHKVVEAESQLGQYPAERGDAFAAAMRRLRSTTDTLQLRAYYDLAYALVDSGMAAAALDVAADRGASVEARVVAFRALTLDAGYWFALPRAWDVTAADLENGCYPASAAGLQRGVDRPLSATFAAQASAVASAAYADAGSPLPARKAAACLRQALSYAAAPVGPGLLRTRARSASGQPQAGRPRARPTGSRHP